MGAQWPSSLLSSKKIPNSLHYCSEMAPVLQTRDYPRLLSLAGCVPTTKYPEVAYKPHSITRPFNHFYVGDYSEHLRFPKIIHFLGNGFFSRVFFWQTLTRSWSKSKTMVSWKSFEKKRQELEKGLSHGKSWSVKKDFLTGGQSYKTFLGNLNSPNSDIWEKASKNKIITILPRLNHLRDVIGLLNKRFNFTLVAFGSIFIFVEMYIF